MAGNNTGRGRARAQTIEDAAPAAPEHVNSVVASIEATGNGVATTTPQRSTTPRSVAMHQSIDGRGSWVWKKTGPHETAAVWDPSAPAVVPLPLPLSADIRGLMFTLAERHKLDRLAFITWCSENAQLVRAACRVHRDSVGQWTSFDPLVAAYREQLQP